MKVLNDLFLGVKTYGTALAFISKHKLWHFFFFPVLIGLFLMVLAYFSIDYAVQQFNLFTEGWLSIDTDSDDWWNISKGVFGTLLHVLIRLGLIFIYLTINKYLVLILVSPVLALLSERVDQILSGKSYPFDGDQFFRDVLRGILIALRNMFLEFGIIFLVFILSIIFPFISPFTAIFLLLVEFYFYGFSLLDYTNERRRLKISQSVRFIRKNKGIAIGNGAMFSLIFLVPLLGMIVAPIVGVVAATLAVHNRTEV